MTRVRCGTNAFPTPPISFFGTDCPAIELREHLRCSSCAVMDNPSRSATRASAVIAMGEEHADPGARVVLQPSVGRAQIKRTSLGEHAPFVCVLPRSGPTHLPNNPAAFNAAAMIGPGDTKPGSWFAFSGGRNPAALKAAAITALASRGRRPL